MSGTFGNFGEAARRRAFAGVFAATIGVTAPGVVQAQADPLRPLVASVVSPKTALPETTNRYGAVFDAWVAQYQPKSAILVVRRSGMTVFAKGHNADPLQPTMIASLSKPITGACVATLVRDGKVSFTTRMRDALSGFFKRYGKPSDKRLEQVTVEQLLVHRSGLVGNTDADPIYQVIDKRIGNGRGYLAAVQAFLSEYLLKLKLIRDPGTRYSYSNTGYEVLTALIEERTGRPYEDYCREAVFHKLGIAAPMLHPDWRVLAGAGGWYIPGPDYLAFFDIFDPRHPFLSDTVKAWIDQAQTRWTPHNRDRWYGLGVNVWAGAGRWSVSHGGIINSHGVDAEGRPTEASIVSHAFRSPDGTSVFIALPWTPDAQHAVDELRRQVGETHKLVKLQP